MGLSDRLGKTITPRELADFLRVSYKTVLTNYQTLGGQRIGKKIIFFENRVIHALEKRSEVDCPGPGGGSPDTESLCNQEGCPGLGERAKANPRNRMESGHGIFPWENGKPRQQIEDPFDILPRKGGDKPSAKGKK